MSVQAMTWVLDHSKSTGSTRCVALAIANHVSADGEGWAYVDRVRAEANVSANTYHRAIAWLEDHGEVIRHVRAGGTQTRKLGGQRPNLFLFTRMRPPEDGEVTAEERGTHPGEVAQDPRPPTDGEVGPPSDGEVAGTHPGEVAPARIEDGAVQEPSLSRPNPSPSAPPPKATDDPVKALAHRLTVLAFEQLEKPNIAVHGKGSAFAAALGLIHRQLAAGTSPEAVEAAVVAGVGVWTTAGLQTAVKQARPRARAPGRDFGQVHDDMAALLHRPPEREALTA